MSRDAKRAWLRAYQMERMRRMVAGALGQGHDAARLVEELTWREIPTEVMEDMVELEMASAAYRVVERRGR